MPQDKTPGRLLGRTFSYEVTSFAAGDSPATYDVNSDLGRNSVDGYIVCDGAGDIIVTFSSDGTNFWSDHTLKKNEVLGVKYLNVNSIKVTHSGTDSAFRILVV